jgi:hypothetical protein
MVLNMTVPFLDQNQAVIGLVEIWSWKGAPSIAGSLTKGPVSTCLRAEKALESSKCGITAPSLIPRRAERPVSKDRRHTRHKRPILRDSAEALSQDKGDNCRRTLHNNKLLLILRSRASGVSKDGLLAPENHRINILASRHLSGATSG